MTSHLCGASIRGAPLPFKCSAAPAVAPIQRQILLKVSLHVRKHSTPPHTVEFEVIKN